MRHQKDFREAPAGPTSPNHPGPFACRYGHRRAKRAHPAAARSFAQHSEHAAQRRFVNVRVDPYRCTVRERDLDRARCSNDRAGDRAGQTRRFHRHLNAGETRCLNQLALQELASPCIKLAGADPMPARDRGRGGARRQAFLDDRPLLIPRPAATALDPGDHFDARSRSTHTSARMTARIGFRFDGVYWRAVSVYHHEASKSWHGGWKQCGTATALTLAVTGCRPDGVRSADSFCSRDQDGFFASRKRSWRSVGPSRSAPWNGSTHPGYSGARALTSSNRPSSSWVSVSSTAARLS